jgi:hypothetical protein
MTWNELKKHIDEKIAEQGANGNVEVNLVHIMDGFKDADNINVTVTEGSVEIEEGS